MKNSLKGAIITTLFAGLLFLGCNDGSGSAPASSQGKLLILQAYGSSSDAAGASHSFVELYNISDTAINLADHFLWYADGTSVENKVLQDGGKNTNTRDGSWKKIALSGSIPGKGSFLIVGPRQNQNTTGSDVARYQIPDNYGDINDNTFTLSNRAFKAALLQGATELTDEVQNPFESSNGKPVSGYIDMVGSANSYSIDGSERDRIFGFEAAPARNSASEAVRRQDLVDTDSNSTDFIAARYAATGTGAFTKEMLEVRKPRNSSAGAWDPFANPAPPVPTKGLMLFQVHGTGFVDTNGANRDTGSVSHSFVELYNNSDSPIDLSTYSVQWANGIANGGGTVLTTIGDWNVIALSGTIPAYGSYLIRGKECNPKNGRLQITAFDKDAGDVFEMSNRSFKVALVSNQTKLALSNPWDNTNSEPLVPELLDLIGARNGGSDSIDAYKGTLITTYSKQQSMRRSSLSSSNDNSADFTGINYNNGNGSTTEGLAKFRPRTATETVNGYTPEF